MGLGLTISCETQLLLPCPVGAALCVQTSVGDLQPLYRSPIDQVLRNNLLHIARLHKPIPNGLRIHHDHRPVLALVKASGLIGPYPALQSSVLDCILELVLQMLPAFGPAARPRSAPIALIQADKNMSFKLCHMAYTLSLILPAFYLAFCHRDGSEYLFPTAISATMEVYMQADNLLSLKDDMVAFIAGNGLRCMNAYVSEDVPSVIFEEETPDSWKDFVEHAKASGANFVTMSEVILEKGDIEILLEQLRDQNYPDEQAPELDDAQYLINYVGKTGYLQLGFAHQGVMFIYETATEWYDRFQQLMEAVTELGGIVVDDPDDE